MKVLANDLRVGDVVQLGGERPKKQWGECVVDVTMDDDGDVRVYAGEGRHAWVNDDDWPFVLVRRAGEAAEVKHDVVVGPCCCGAWHDEQHPAKPDTETFTARIGTWLWACAKEEAGEDLEILYARDLRTGEEEWRPANNPHDAILRNGRWRIKPVVVPPTLEECLSHLEDLWQDSTPRSGGAHAASEALLRRAGLLKGVK